MSSLTVAALFAEAPVPSAEDIAERVAQADIEGSAQLKSYTSVRRYVISSPRFDKPAEITVRMTFLPEQGKSFEIISSQGAEGMQKRILQKILDGEKEASRQKATEDMRLSPKNYDVSLLGTELKNGTKCYVLAIKPKRKSKFLLEGKAWINAADYGVVHVEGRPSERISFWVGKPDVTQSFEKVGPVWMMSSNRSVADIKLVGRSELAIHSSDIQVKLTGTNEIARSMSGKRAHGAAE